ncbi:MAG: 50S ribosomal protein L18a [Methanomicrobium sp.]|jgi:large subunit ribosomal protein LX|uniref:50S ribosomal protein L18Ae n=1 Tax=Methanomicrobium mobile TaxID=2205 RepID=UPI0005B27C17|nr:50S ribosomal protein L18Ae [Methanomicrobium mobile]MBP5475364.1 50S ribosomal protein L18a [Methanomicrobium sp.]
MADQKFEVKGTFKNGYDYQPFTKEIVAPNEKQATERLLATIGSKHRLKRSYINIETVKPVDGE